MSLVAALALAAGMPAGAPDAFAPLRAAYSRRLRVRCRSAKPGCLARAIVLPARVDGCDETLVPDERFTDARGRSFAGLRVPMLVARTDGDAPATTVITAIVAAPAAPASPACVPLRVKASATFLIVPVGALAPAAMPPNAVAMNGGTALPVPLPSNPDNLSHFLRTFGDSPALVADAFGQSRSFSLVRPGANAFDWVFGSSSDTALALFVRSQGRAAIYMGDAMIGWTDRKLRIAARAVGRLTIRQGNTVRPAEACTRGVRDGMLELSC